MTIQTQLDALIDQYGDETPFPDELAGYAAQAAANELCNNWKDALACGDNIQSLVRDVDDVIELLREFKARAAKLA